MFANDPAQESIREAVRVGINAYVVDGLSPERIKFTRDALAAAERASGGQRRAALTQLATQLNSDVALSSDAGKMKLLVSALADLAKAR